MISQPMDAVKDSRHVQHGRKENVPQQDVIPQVDCLKRDQSPPFKDVILQIRGVSAPLQSTDVNLLIDGRAAEREFLELVSAGDHYLMVVAREASPFNYHSSSKVTLQVLLFGVQVSSGEIHVAAFQNKG